MISDLLQTPLFGIGLTLAVYGLAQMGYKRTGSMWLNPVAVSIVAIIGFLVASGIPYRTYAVGGNYVLFLLGPSVVALAVPLYQRRREITARWRPIMAGIFSGAVSSIISASGLAWTLHGSREVVLSLAPKSVTTPIAISIVEKIGGIPPLTAALVVCTGCLGAICGPEFCRWIGIRDRMATGLAVGTAAHGIGTARMLEEDRLAGAVSGLAIGLNGLVTAFILAVLFSLWG